MFPSWVLTDEQKILCWRILKQPRGSVTRSAWVTRAEADACEGLGRSSRPMWRRGEAAVDTSRHSVGRGRRISTAPPEGWEMRLSPRRLRAPPHAGQRLCIPWRSSVCGQKSWDRQGRHHPVNASDPEDLSRPVRHLHRPCQLHRLHRTFADKLPDLVLQPQPEIFGELRPFLGFIVRRPVCTWSGCRASRWKRGLGLGDC